MVCKQPKSWHIIACTRDLVFLVSRNELSKVELQIVQITDRNGRRSKADIRHLKIDVYRGLQTSAGHVTRLQPRVYGKFSTFSTARGRFSRKSFTSTFICMNVL